MQKLYRIGQIIPSSKTTTETEIPAMRLARRSIRPERFTLHSSPMRMKKVVKEELAAMDQAGRHRGAATAYFMRKSLGLEAIAPGADALISAAY